MNAYIGTLQRALQASLRNCHLLFVSSWLLLPPFLGLLCKRNKCWFVSTFIHDTVGSLLMILFVSDFAPYSFRMDSPWLEQVNWPGAQQHLQSHSEMQPCFDSCTGAQGSFFTRPFRLRWTAWAALWIHAMMCTNLRAISSSVQRLVSSCAEVRSGTVNLINNPACEKGQIASNGRWSHGHT